MTALSGVMEMTDFTAAQAMIGCLAVLVTTA